MHEQSEVSAVVLREVSNLDICQLPESKLIQSQSDLAVIRSGWSPKPAQMNIAACHHEFAGSDWELPVQSTSLREIGGSVMTGPHRISQQPDRSLCWTKNPAMFLSRVLLPAPFGPSSPTRSPGSMRRETDLSAGWLHRDSCRTDRSPQWQESHAPELDVHVLQTGARITLLATVFC